MKIVTSEEFKNFILEQPDDRRVDMRDTSSDDECGCVMVHYGNTIKISKQFSCGASFWWGSGKELARFDSDDRVIWSFFDSRMHDAETYGELKKHLIKN